MAGDKKRHYSPTAVTPDLRGSEDPHQHGVKHRCGVPGPQVKPEHDNRKHLSADHGETPPLTNREETQAFRTSPEQAREKQNESLH